MDKQIFTLDTLVHVMRARAERHPERPAIAFLGDGDNVTSSLTYGELDRTARAMAAGLQARAVPGARVLLMLDTGPDYVAAFLGCLYAGLVAVPAYPPEPKQPQALQRLLGMLADSDASLALTDSSGLAGLPNAIAVRALTPADCRGEADAWQHPIIRTDDLAFLQYTSGSTSAPKGVMVRHRQMLANEKAMATRFAMSAQDHVVSWLPLYHDMGLIFGLLQPFYSGLGLTLMSPQRFFERPRRWLEAIARVSGPVVSGGPDFAYRLCVERIRPASVASLDLSRWRMAFSGAEPVRPASMEAFLTLAAPLSFNATSLYPCYGLAEATLFVTGGAPGSGALVTEFDTASLAQGRALQAPGSRLVACGAIAPEHVLSIVDPATGRELPSGQLGEVWVSGPSITQGYWRQPDISQQSMAAHRTDGAGPFLRTGDLGFLHEGQLYLNGRCKDLIILRGRNFYPQDLEAVIEAEVAGLRPGRVAAFAAEWEGTEAIGIAAEVARAAEDQADSIMAAIQAAVGRAFGEAVAAIALLKAGTLPKTTSGKLQRSACRQAWQDGRLDTVAVYRAPAGDQSFAAPETPTEHRLAALWEALLEQSPIGREDNFFARGGQSLLLTQLAARVQTEFGVLLPLAEYFQARTLAELAARIDAAPVAAAMPALVPQDMATSPASFAQQRLWFLQSLAPDSAYYHVATGLSFSAAVDRERLQSALDALVERHTVLRTVLVETAEGLAQQVQPPFAFPLETGVAPPLDRAELATDAVVKAWLSASFDLARGPLLRGLLLGAETANPVLLLVAHHIVVDGWSLKVLLSELAALYAGNALEPLTLQYRDFAAWQQQTLLPRLPALAAEWTAKLQAAPVLTTLPSDLSRPPVQSHRGASLSRELPAALVQRLDSLAQARQSSLYMLLFAAYAATLAESSGQWDVVIGIDVANRHTPGVAPLLGFFVNQLPLRCRLHAGMSGGELLEEARQGLLWAYERQDLPFDKLVEALRPPRDLAHAPVFQTKFVLQDAPPATLSLGPGLSLQPFALARDTAELDLLFDLAREADGAVSLRVEYAVDLYRPETVTGFISRFVVRLEALLTDLQAPVFAASGTARRPIIRRAARPAIVPEA